MILKMFIDDVFIPHRSTKRWPTSSKGRALPTDYISHPLQFTWSSSKILELKIATRLLCCLRLHLQHNARSGLRIAACVNEYNSGGFRL